MKILENTLGTNPTHAWGGNDGGYDKPEVDVYGSIRIGSDPYLYTSSSVVSDEILEAHYTEVHAILYSAASEIGIRVTEWGVELAPDGVDFTPNRWYEKD